MLLFFKISVLNSDFNPAGMRIAMTLLIVNSSIIFRTWPVTAILTSSGNAS
jgi:hypothetical protein